jgi:hypothetical protein
MRIPNAVHQSRPWRIHEILSDFIVEDVWALPVHGGVEDAPRALGLVTTLDPAKAESRPARALWNLRRWLGSRFGWDDDAGMLPIPGTGEVSLAGRLPDDLRDTSSDMDFGRLPFKPLYRTDREMAAELSNHTVHGVMHLGWVDKGEGRYQAEMAVYVKPRGRFGAAYMAAIRPFRHWVVYPALMRQIGRAWSRAT